MVLAKIVPCHWTQDVNWTNTRHSEDVLNLLWTSYVRSIYVRCPVGSRFYISTENILSIVRNYIYLAKANISSYANDANTFADCLTVFRREKDFYRAWLKTTKSFTNKEFTHFFYFRTWSLWYVCFCIYSKKGAGRTL